MKQSWTLFVSGVFVALLVSIYFNIYAQSVEGRRGLRIDRDEISALKTDVPLSREMDSALRKRENTIKERELQLSEREEILKVEEERVRALVDKLQELQESQKNWEEEQDKKYNTYVAKLVKTYSKMKAKKAAQVIESLETDLAVAVLEKMKEKSIGAIFNSMDPEIAKELSSRLVKRSPAVGGKGREFKE